MSRLRIAIKSFNLDSIDQITQTISAEDLADLNMRERDETPLELLAKKTHNSIIQYAKLQMPEAVMQAAKAAILFSIELCQRLIILGADLSSLNVIGTIPMQLLHDDEIGAFRRYSASDTARIPDLYNEALDLSNKLFDSFIKTEIVGIQGHRERTILLYAAWSGDVYLINKILDIGGIDLLTIADSKGYTPLILLATKISNLEIEVSEINADARAMLEDMILILGEQGALASEGV